MTQMNLSMRQKQTHRHREQTGGCQGEGAGGAIEWESGISRCKLLFTACINKALLYSTDNCTEYPTNKPPWTGI